MRQPQNIHWADRDIGQKMSIVIFNTFYIAFWIATMFYIVTETPYGQWALVALAFVLGLATNEFFHRWRQRNARR